MRDLSKIDKLASTYKILSNPTRLCILCQLIKNNRMNVSQLACCSDRAQSYISQELSKLKSWGVVQSERVGLKNYYSIIDNDISKIIKLNCNL